MPGDLARSPAGGASQSAEAANAADEIAITYGDDSGGVMIEAGNSTVILAAGGPCIGQLGQLPQPLDDARFAAIGRLGVVMVPIDGTYTMSLDGVSEITRRLRAAVVLPMHRFATPLDEFMRRIGQQFEIDVRTERS